MDGDGLVGGTTPRLFTVFDYHRMAESGAIPHDARTELVEGVVLNMPAIGTPHLRVVNGLTMLLAPLVTGRATVSVQNALRLDTLSEPQPDIVLLKPDHETDLSRQPEAADAFLLIEVADTSLPYDRNTKARLYATASVREYWIVDIPTRAVEIHRHPEQARYTQIERTTAGPLALPGLDLAITVEAIFKVLA